MSPLDRRSLLKGAGAFAGVSLMAGAAPRRLRAAPDDERTLDVAVIGGGVSGAYCAWRLTRPDAAGSAILRASGVAGAPRVGLFEGSGRIGGRLWSFVPPGMPHLRAELGGMRIPADQSLVLALVNELGVETIPFPMGGSENPRYLRGTRLTVAQLGDPQLVPYNLPTTYRGMTPDEIVEAAVATYIPEASSMHEEAWAEVRQAGEFEGVPLRDLGFRYLMARALPEEAYAFVSDSAATNDFTLDTNAVELMHDWDDAFIDLSPIVTPLLGMEEIPAALAAAAAEAGAVVARQHRLRRITPIPGAGSDEPGLLLEIEDVASGEVGEIATRHVILAMPPRAISLLAADSLPLIAPSFAELRDAVVPIRVGKGFLGYERAWWRNLGLESGRGVSDLPLRLTYYFGVESERPGGEPGNHSALLMPTYAEREDFDFWMSFRRQGAETAGGAPFQRPEIGTVPDELALPERAVAEMQRQLQLMHGPQAQIGEPTMAVMSDWSQDPYGGGYHVWAIGADPWRMGPLARQPAPGVNLSICGEAWSTHQGWSLGALMTAEQTLQQRLGLAWPEWLPSGVELGP